VNIKELTAKMQLSTTTYTTQGKKPNAWTPAEDAILHQHFAKGGAGACREHLPNRSDKAIRLRASNIGAKYREQALPWTKAEDDLMVAHYSQRGSEYVAQATNRTQLSVRHRARRLGLKADLSLRGIERVARGKAKKPPMPQKVLHGPKLTVVKRKEKQKKDQWSGEAEINSKTIVTIAAPFIDRRWVPDVVPRVVDSRECRDWAAQV
jgi:hypothetical protein